MAELTQPSITLTDDDELIEWISKEGNNDMTLMTDAEAGVDPRICLVGSLADDHEAQAAAQKFGVPIVHSLDGQDMIEDISFSTFFILADFECEVFDELHKRGVRLLGKPALLEQSEEGILTYSQRPVFCHVMKNIVLVFTGFRKKAEVSRLLKLTHYMGGSVKNEINEKVTHLLAHSSTGEKYQYAVTFNIPVMGEEWVKAAWAYRDELQIRANTEAMDKYRLRVFHNLRIVLIGFPDEERDQMEDLLRNNAGTPTTLEDITATHVVIEEQCITEKPSDCPPRAHVLRAEWFWASIQMDACAAEKMYLFEELNSSYMMSPRNVLSPSTPGTGRSRRRKRLRETVQQLAENDSPSTHPNNAPPTSKRRSSVGDLAYLSADGSWLLDDSKSTPSRIPSIADCPMSPPLVDLKQLSARQRVFHELVKTECNYVSILDVVTKVIKEPLEDPNQLQGVIIDPQDLRYIFGNIPPIHDVHTRMKNDLLKLAHDWKDDASIGDIILKYCPDLEKAYPPFINFFEGVKGCIQRLCLEKPRFHAFLKIAQSKQECGRQSFQELLIRPVQRLPSMALLINDILKYTEKTAPDHAALEQALDKIRSVMTYINDDKRKTEAKLKLFEIHNDIENCPPNLVASHRMYRSKVDVTELSDSCSGRGDTLTLFLFNDVLEICKKKSKYNSIKSPSRANLHAIKSIKSYKHIEMMNLAHIKRIVDIKETEDCHNVFALIIRSNHEVRERLLTVTLIPEEISKQSFLKNLCQTVANAVSRNDVENFLVSMDPQHLDIETSDVSLTTALNKAIRFATKTGRKVTRAFSFNRTPSKSTASLSPSQHSLDSISSPPVGPSPLRPPPHPDPPCNHQSSYLSSEYPPPPPSSQGVNNPAAEPPAHTFITPPQPPASPLPRFATRTGRKVSRAFSFNKSPSKLKRAVSTVMSPFGTISHQGSMRGATSVNNLADLSLSSTPPSGGPIMTPTLLRRQFKNT